MGGESAAASGAPQCQQRVVLAHEGQGGGWSPPADGGTDKKMFSCHDKLWWCGTGWAEGRGAADAQHQRGRVTFLPRASPMMFGPAQPKSCLCPVSVSARLARRGEDDPWEQV